MKKEDITAFKNTKRGNKVYPLLNRLQTDGILCIICAIFLIVTTIIMKDSKWFYILAGILIVAGIFFILMSRHFKSDEIYRMKLAKKKKLDKVDKK